MSHDAFKRDLSTALPVWVSAGLISPEQAEALRDFHGLHALPAHGQGRFAWFLLGFGALLVGIGLITLVAANWDGLSPPVRFFGAFVLLLATQIAGDRLYRDPARSRLGSALLLLGALLIGANIALLAQWFQIGGTGWGLFFAWSLGALALGLGLRHGVIVALAGWLWWAAFVAAPADLQPWFPWGFALIYVPLSIYCDSRVLLYLAFAGLYGSSGWLPHLSGGMVSGVLLANAALWWAWARWQERRPLNVDPNLVLQPERARLLGALPDTFAMIALVVLYEVWAFKDLATGAIWRPTGALSLPEWTLLGGWAIALVLAWVLPRPLPGKRMVHYGFVGASAALLAALALIAPGGWLLAFPLNVLLFFGLLGLGYVGLIHAERRWFYIALAGLSFQILARFVEIETSLLLKAAVFMAWGLVLIAIGWRFERGLSRPRPDVTTRSVG